jgi:TetR/AcrR family transcriptional regulator, repressor for uid operon
MPTLTAAPNTDRRQQILAAAMICFAKRGFHQTSMHDISAEAGISVGLIYRYFENKEAVISAMAAEHRQEIEELLARARQAPSLLEALEVFFTAHCCAAGECRIESAFVVDLFAEGSRNPRIARLVREILDALADGVAKLIAQSPEARTAGHGMTPRQQAELIFATSRGMLMRDVVDLRATSDTARRERQIELVRRLWRLLFADPVTH